MTDHDVTGLLLDLEFIAEHWPALAATRIPGTRRPWRQPLLDPGRRDEMAARDRVERAEGNVDAPGFTSAALHVDVLDVMVELWVVVHELTEATATAVLAYIPGKDRHPKALNADLPLAIRRLDEMPAMIEFASTWLNQTAARLPAGLIPRTTRRLHRLTTDIQRLLSLLRGGQILAAATCPWCQGITPKHPAGGATTLRVEEIEKEKPATAHRPAMPALYAVVCHGPTCRPPDTDCGTWWRNHPAWPDHEWDWLSKRLDPAEPTRTQAPPRVPADYKIQPIEHSGRTGQMKG